MTWPKGKKRGQREKCKRGHVLTGDNVWTRPSDGKRYCRTCQRASRGYQRNNLKGQAKMCRRGLHERNPQNTLIDPQGRKHCQACVFEDGCKKRQATRTSHSPAHPDVTALMEQQAQGPQAQLKAYLESQDRTKVK